MKVSMIDNRVSALAAAWVVVVTGAASAAPIDVSGAYNAYASAVAEPQAGPNLAIHGDHVAVMWRSASQQIAQAYSSGGGVTFAAPSAFISAGFKHHTSNIKYGNDGTLHQMWVQHSDAVAPAYRRSTDHGVTWSTSVYPGGGRYPRYGGIALAVSSDGQNLQQLYYETGASAIREVSSNDGGLTWSAGTNINHWGAGGLSLLTMKGGLISSGVFDNSTNFFALTRAWYDVGDVGLAVISKKADWGRVSFGGSYTNYTLANEHAMATDGTNLYIVYSYFADIYFRQSTDAGSTWSAAVRVDKAATGSQLKPVIALTSDGRFVVAWQDDRSGVNQIYYATSATGTNWSESPVWPSETAQTEPDLVITDKTPHLVWADGGTRVMFYTLAPRGAVIAIQ